MLMPRRPDQGRRNFGQVDPFCWMAAIPLGLIAMVAFFNAAALVGIGVLALAVGVVFFDAWANRPYDEDDEPDELDDYWSRDPLEDRRADDRRAEDPRRTPPPPNQAARAQAQQRAQAQRAQAQRAQAQRAQAQGAQAQRAQPQRAQAQQRAQAPRTPPPPARTPPPPGRPPPPPPRAPRGY
jgi:hypothetical protein